MIVFVPFQPALGRSSFDCGRPELNRWFRESAGQQERAGSARTTFAVDDDRPCIAGFFTLVTFQLEPADAPPLGGMRKYPISAVLLACLAVDRRYQGDGLGKLALVEAMRRIALASKDIGFEIVVVDALDEGAAGFYLKHGFRRFAEHSLKLFMTTKNLRATFDTEPA